MYKKIYMNKNIYQVTVLILISLVLMNNKGYTAESKIGFINVQKIIKNGRR